MPGLSSFCCYVYTSWQLGFFTCNVINFQCSCQLKDAASSWPRQQARECVHLLQRTHWVRAPGLKGAPHLCLPGLTRLGLGWLAETLLPQVLLSNAVAKNRDLSPNLRKTAPTSLPIMKKPSDVHTAHSNPPFGNTTCF